MTKVTCFGCRRDLDDHDPRCWVLARFRKEELELAERLLASGDLDG